MMGLILIGIIAYFILSVIEEKQKAKKNKKPKITNTDLTDFELRPIEKQDMNYDEASIYFNSARNS